MASVGWQIGGGGVPVAVSSLSHAYYGTPAQPAKSRRALATALPLRKVLQSPKNTLIPLLVPECVAAPGSVILASADGANFRVSRNVLTYASPIFRRLFSAQKSEPLDSPLSSTSSISNLDYLRFPDETLTDGTPLIRLPESGKTLDALLRYLYPFPPSSNELSKEFTSKRSSHICIEELKPVLEAAQKYVILSVLDEICARLLSDLALPPSDEEGTFALRVYALACQLNRKGLAEAAAFASAVYIFLSSRTSPQCITTAYLTTTGGVPTPLSIY